MKTASERFLNVRIFPFSDQNPVLVAHAKKIATVFNRLYEQRQTADYDTATQWTRTEVLTLVDSAAAAFESMKAIRGLPVLDDYLLSLFLKERR